MAEPQSPVGDSPPEEPDAWRSLRELPRPAVVLLLGVAVNRMGTLVQAFLVLYLTKIDYSPGTAGLVLTAFGAGGIAGELSSGTVIDRVGPRRTILISMVTAGSLVTGLSVVHHLAGITVLCVLTGAVTFLYWPASVAYLAVVTPGDRLVMSSAAFRFALNVGAVVAPMLGVLLLTHSYTLVFLVDAGTSFAFAAVVGRLLPDLRPAGTGADEPFKQLSGQQGSGGRFVAVLQDRRYALVLVAILLATIVEVQYQAILPLHIVDRGYSTALYAAVLAVNAVLVIGVELPLTPLVLRLPTRVAMAMGTALIGVGLALFGVPAGVWLFFVAAVVWTAGEIVSAPSTIAYPARVAPPGLQGSYIGLFSACQTTGYTLGPALGLTVYQFAGSLAWTLCLVLGLVAGTVLWAAVRQPRGTADGVVAGP